MVLVLDADYVLSLLWDLDFLWLLHWARKLLSGARGFSEDISHPTWSMNSDGSVFWKDHSRHPLGLPDTLCKLSSPSLLVFGTDKPGVKPRQWQWWTGCDPFVEFSNNGCVYQPDKDLLWWTGVSKVSFVGKEVRWNWVSPLVLFCGMRGRNIAGKRSFCHCSRGWFDRADFLQNRDILHTPPSSSHLQLFWPLRVSHNLRTKDFKKN